MPARASPTTTRSAAFRYLANEVHFGSFTGYLSGVDAVHRDEGADVPGQAVPPQEAAGPAVGGQSSGLA